MRSDILYAIIIYDKPETVQELENRILKLYPNTVIELLELKSIQDGVKCIDNLNPDVAFLAHDVSSNNQFEICTYVRSISGCEHIPIILLTTNTNEVYLKNVLNEGCDAYLLSPVNESALLMQIQLSLKIRNLNIEKKLKTDQTKIIKDQNIEESKQNEEATLQLLTNLQKEIEARKITENELRASEKRLSRAEIASKSGNWEFDIESKHFYASLGATEIYGTKERKFSEKDVRNAAFESDRGLLDKALKDVINNNTTYNIDYKINRIDNGKVSMIRSVASYDKFNNKVFGVIRDITDEVLTQEALHQSESMYNAILESSPDYIALTDLDGNFLSCSNSAVRVFGNNNEQEIIGQNFLSVIEEEDLERALQDFTKIRKGLYDGGTNEYKAIKKDGSFLNIELTTSLIRNSYGEISKLLFLARDITERKKNEEATLLLLEDLKKEIEARKVIENELRASKKRLSRAELASKSGNWELDLGTQMIYMSAGAAEIYGTNKLTQPSNALREATLIEYREFLIKAINDHVKGIAPYNVEFKIKRMDNGNISDIRSTGIYDKENNTIFGVLQDITEEVMTQEALYQSESLYKAILDSSPDDITVTDLNGVILMCSKSIVKTYGYENENQIIGKNILNYFSPKDLERLLNDFKLLKSTGNSTGPNEYVTIKEDGSSFQIEVMSGIIRDSNGEISKLLFLARAITERKKNEQKILKSEIEFRTIWDYSPNGLGLSDENGNVIRVNKALSKILEIGMDDFDEKTIEQIVPIAYKINVLDVYKYHFNNRSLVSNIELEFEVKPNLKKWLQFDFAFLDFENEKSLLLSIVNDITERKIAESRIRNLTRLYSLLGQINQVIVRQRNDLKLMQQICDVAIQYGEFKFAWFGEYNTTDGFIKFICESGSSKNYIKNIDATFTNLYTESNAFKKIIFKKEVVCCNDISQEKEIVFNPSEALKNEFNSMAVLPIERKGTVNYLLYIYSDKKDFFKEDEEQKLLSEMAQSISLAIETIDVEKVRIETENALKESENRYNTFINNNIDMIFVKDNKFRYLVVNDSFTKLIGLKNTQIINKTNEELTNQERYIECLETDKRALQSDSPIVYLETIGDRIFETTKFKMPIKDGQFGIGGIMHDITHRKKQEMALEESRLELQSIYDNAPVLMCLLDEDKKIVFKNEEFKQFFNLQDCIKPDLTVDDVLGCDNNKILYENYAETDCGDCIVQKAIESTLTKGTTEQNFEYYSNRNTNDSRNEIYLLGSSSLIQSSGKRKVLLTFIDITNRKKAEKALSESNNRFELAMDVANMAWWETDFKTGETNFGRKSIELLGYSSGYFKNFDSFLDLIHPDDYESVNTAYSKHINGESDKVEAEYRIKTESGKYKYFYDIGSVSKRNSHGEPLVMSGLIMDITERKISDEALEKSEIFLRTFINNIPFQIWARDENNIGILENKMLVDTFSSILGKKPTPNSKVTSELAIAWEKQNSQVLKGDIIDEEVELIRNGEVYEYHQIVFPINLNNKIIGIAGLIIDITDRKRIQNALRESQKELKKFAGHLQYVREEERVSLSREIHDELGQILVAIKFDLGMLKQKARKSSDKNEVELYEHLSMLVDNTLKTTRRIMTDLRPELLDMLGFVDAVKAHIKSFVDRQNVDCVFKSKITNLQLDSQRSVALFRILQESLNNILKHAKATKIIVKLDKLKENSYFLEISDNGRGFDQSKKSRSDSYGLLGMRERAYLLDAKLTITSKPNEGTTIRIEFQG